MAGSRIPDPGSPVWDDMVLVGRIGRPHGLRGHVAVNPETDFVEERFRPGAILWMRIEGREASFTIASVRLKNGRPVIAFEGLTRREDVEPLAGLELRVPEGALRPLEPGRFYEHQLVGCVVETTGGAVLGRVVRVEGGLGGSRLVVDGTRSEILIPLVVDICVDIDVTAKRIRIEPPEGLIDLNETKRGRKMRSGVMFPRTPGAGE
jgi:16S rRNA processing protein RimM